MPTNTECLDTLIQNATGDEATFTFLPPHGVTLAANEFYSISGDLTTRLADNKRKMKSLRDAVSSGALKIIRTPALHLFDNGTDKVKILTLTSGTLGIADPTWSEGAVYSSEGDYTPGA